MRSTTALAAAITSLLIVGPARAETPPADQPADQPASLRLTRSVELDVLNFKYRLRNGAPDRRGTSLLASDLGTGAVALAPGATLGVELWGTERVTVSGWWFRLEGRSRFERETHFGGVTYPIGSRVSSDVRLAHLALDYRHRFRIREWIAVDVGAALELTSLRSEVGPARLRLRGIYPTPQLGLTVTPRTWLDVELAAGGFDLPLRSGRVSVTEQTRVTLTVRWRPLDHVALELGLRMHHLHIETDHGTTEADVLHARLRGGFVALSVTF